MILSLSPGRWIATHIELTTSIRPHRVQIASSQVHPVLLRMYYSSPPRTNKRESRGWTDRRGERAALGSATHYFEHTPCLEKDFGGEAAQDRRQKTFSFTIHSAPLRTSLLFPIGYSSVVCRRSSVSISVHSWFISGYPCL